MFFSRLVRKENESIHLVITTTDIIKFRESIGKKCENSSKCIYAELKLTVIADLVSFNKKRDHEVSGFKGRDMILQQSLACERAKAADNALVKLTKLEEKFAEVYTLLRLPGKGGKVVPDLMPPDTLKLLDIMISDDNLKNETYFFQKEGGKLHYRSAEALNKFAKDFELENKPLFWSTKHRKHVATAAQFLNLPQHQRTWVADFLGHDLWVHDKLLYMVDSGKLEDA